MNYQWLGSGAAYPIVEFHEIRVEPGQSDRYVEVLDGTLAGPLAAAGGTVLGHFRVAGQPDKLLLMRGFPSPAARARALGRFYGSDEWGRARRELIELTRSHEVVLTRAVKPADGPKALLAGEAYVAVISELRYAEQIGPYHLWLRLLLRKAGMNPVAAFATLEAVNDVPAVPVMRNRSHHVALLRTHGTPPVLPRELRGMVRFQPEWLTLEPAWSLVW